MSVHVLVVEDDPDLGDEIVFFLEQAGMVAGRAGDAAQARDHLVRSPCDVLVIDVGLPGAEDGIMLAQGLADRDDLGIVILTARDRLEDRLDGWRCGAHVYLVKPAPLAELEAVIRAVYRRLPRGTGLPWRLDERGRQLVTPAGTAVRLTFRETRLLGAFAEEDGRLARDVAWVDGASLDALVYRLRRKLSAHGSPIRTHYGFGYVFDAPLERFEGGRGARA
jgi:DNA-binding response OmpR family regulator